MNGAVGKRLAMMFVSILWPTLGVGYRSKKFRLEGVRTVSNPPKNKWRTLNNSQCLLLLLFISGKGGYTKKMHES